MSLNTRPINFDPIMPIRPARAPNPNTRTGKVLELILRPNGITLEEIRDELNKLEGEKLDLKKTRNWLTKSFLAPRGFGIESEFDYNERGEETLRIYGKSLNLQTPGRVNPPKDSDKPLKERGNTDVKPRASRGSRRTDRKTGKGKASGGKQGKESAKGSYNAA